MRVRCSHVRGSQVRGSQVRAMVGKTRADFLSKHIKYLARTHMSALIPYRPDDIASSTIMTCDEFWRKSTFC